MNLNKEISSKEITQAIKAFIFSLNLYKEKINNLNVFPVPDGDTGTNMYRTLKGVQSRVQEQELFTIGDLSKVISLAALYEGRGNSGVILAQIIRGLFSCLNETIDWYREYYS